jgi:hypothetical protein
MLSDALHEFATPGDADVRVLAHGCLSPQHATQFTAFVKQLRGKYKLSAILKGEETWPDRPEDRDVLYFLAQSLRAKLIKELPSERETIGPEGKELAHRSKALLKDLAALSLEMAQLVVVRQDDGSSLPGWLLAEVVRDLPRLAERA